MPGKHAPKSGLSFYLSMGRATGGVFAAIALVVIITVVAFGGRDRMPKTSTAPTTPATRSGGSPSATPATAPSPTPTPAVRSPSQITVAVLNGSGRTGIAHRTADQATAAGYQVKKVGNTDAAARVSTIYYRPGFQAAAKALQRRFPGFTQVKPAGSGVPSDVMITMVIGEDYP